MGPLHRQNQSNGRMNGLEEIMDERQAECLVRRNGIRRVIRSSPCYHMTATYVSLDPLNYDQNNETSPTQLTNSSRDANLHPWTTPFCLFSLVFPTTLALVPGVDFCSQRRPALDPLEECLHFQTMAIFADWCCCNICCDHCQ